MLSEEENRTLTQAGPGTPMGDLLRRYWQPIAAVTELDAGPTKRIQLLGEFLVLYRDLGGTYGLVHARCAHRLTDLSYGIAEDYGLRCPMHGWLYSETGQCLEQPLEPEPFAHEVKITAYPVAVKGGIVWAYLGPEPAPLVPDWEPFGWEDGLVQVVFAELPCNWLQCQENALDPIDIEFFHQGLSQTARSDLPARLPNLQFDFDEFEYGFIYRRALRERAANKDDWSVGRTCVWPNGVFSGNTRSCHFEWRVPIDDTTTLTVAWFIDRVAPGAKLPAEQRFHHWYAPIKDEQSGAVIESHLLNRNFVIWLNQAPIVDRTQEHLVQSDRGIVVLREKYFSQIGLVADGGEPKAVLRDAAKNRGLPLPFTVPRLDLAPEPLNAAPEADTTGGFPYLAGQPQAVADLYKQVVASWQPPLARARTRRPAATNRRPRKPKSS